jgi:hypothetical protein
VGAVIGFTVNEAGTQLRSGTRRTVNEADFTVNVLDPVVDEPTRDAPAIANEYLRNRADNGDCQERQGTNKNKNNWHGQLVSKVAKEFAERSFTASQEGVVTTFVESLCG